MKFRYIGDPRDNFAGPNSVNLFGIDFSRSGFTEVPDKVAIRLAKHAHFESDGSPLLASAEPIAPPDAPALVVPEDPAAEIPAAVPAEVPPE